MDYIIIKKYIEQYKNDFPKISEQELYKWKAVKCFQDNWDVNAKNFSDMLEISLKEARNLLDSGKYFPKRMLLKNAIKNQSIVKSLFIKLYDEQDDLISRITGFIYSLNLINKKYFPNKQSFQDPRAVMVYLALKYPERYFLYKYEMFKEFVNTINYNYIPVKGRLENVFQYQILCRHIRDIITKDQELIKLHNKRIGTDCYYDNNYTILTQDFIYAVVNYLELVKSISQQKCIVGEVKVSEILPDNDVGEVSFEGKVINRIENDRENKRIGELGEKWVIQRENTELIKAGLREKVKLIKHVSVEKGDGTGYDIKSFDKNGDDIYIEVKTTTGALKTPFYITRNELARSQVEGVKYRLYRVYNFNEIKNEASLLILKGDLSKICNCPTQYIVRIKDK